MKLFSFELRERITRAAAAAAAAAAGEENIEAGDVFRSSELTAAGGAALGEVAAGPSIPIELYTTRISIDVNLDRGKYSDTCFYNWW